MATRHPNFPQVSAQTYTQADLNTNLSDSGLSGSSRDGENATANSGSQLGHTAQYAAKRSIFCKD